MQNHCLYHIEQGWLWPSLVLTKLHPFGEPFWLQYLLVYGLIQLEVWSSPKHGPFVAFIMLSRKLGFPF
jgi:hypothetical protein